MEIIRLLEEAGAPYLRVPFDPGEYSRLGWDVHGVPPQYAPHTLEFFNLLDEAQQGRVLARLYRHKNNYVINNNGGRNKALREGRDRATWVLPWDGNCFVTAEACDVIRSAVLARPQLRYWVVPMARVIDNHELLKSDFRTEAEEEPQIPAVEPEPRN
jgi:hypothetical protein